MTHRNLLVEVWGVEYEDDLQVLRAHVANLRRKIEPQGEHVFIRTDPAWDTGSPLAWSFVRHRRTGPDAFTKSVYGSAASSCGLDGGGRIVEMCSSTFSP